MGSTWPANSLLARLGQRFLTSAHCGAGHVHHEHPHLTISRRRKSLFEKQHHKNVLNVSSCRRSGPGRGALSRSGQDGPGHSRPRNGTTRRQFQLNPSHGLTTLGKGNDAFISLKYLTKQKYIKKTKHFPKENFTKKNFFEHLLLCLCVYWILNIDTYKYYTINKCSYR